MPDVQSIIDSEGRILQQGDITDQTGSARPGKVSVEPGMYLLLNDGTVAGPMVQRGSEGDVYKWFGARFALPNPDNPDEEASHLGGVWLDSQGNAHSDSSPLDAAAVYTDPVSW